MGLTQGITQLILIGLGLLIFTIIMVYLDNKYGFSSKYNKKIN